MNYIKLNILYLKTFTKQDAFDYYQLNNLNSDNIIKLVLDNNELTDISGIKIFKNLKELYINYNKGYLKDISVVKYLNNLIGLDIDYLQLESDQIEYIKFLKNLKNLFRRKGFKDMSVLNRLDKNIELY